MNEREDEHVPEMHTELLDAIAHEEAAILRAAEILASGELVAFPTETVYGLGARIFDTKQIAKIFRAKRRPADNPLIAHVASIAQVEVLCDDLPPAARLLMDQFFPGPLTLVCRRRVSIPDIVSAGLESIAFRMPANSIAQKLIRAVGQPLVAPSANLSGRPSPTRAEHVMHDLQGRIAAVVDGGRCQIGLESTVLSLLHQQPCILRPGAVSAAQIEDLLNCKVALDNGTADQAVVAPGMKYRHYAPTIPVIAISSLDEVESNSSNYVILALANPRNDSRIRELRSDSLYAEFLRAENEGLSAIYVLLSAELESNAALMNRLTKAISSRG